MKGKISKAQIEVWEWKEQLSDVIRKLPNKERVRYLKDKSSKVVENLRKRNKVAK